MSLPLGAFKATIWANDTKVSVHQGLAFQHRRKRQALTNDLELCK